MFVFKPKRKVFGGEKLQFQLNLYTIISLLNINGLDTGVQVMEYWLITPWTHRIIP